MKTLLKYERAKILRRKTTVITCLLTAISIVVLCVVFVSDYTYYDATGKTLSGSEAIKDKRAAQATLTGELSVDFMKKALKLDQSVRANPSNYNSGTGNLRNDIYVHEILPYEDILGLMRGVYSPVGEYRYDILSTIGEENVDDFYKLRHEKVLKILNMHYSYGNYSDAEKNFILSKDAQVSDPFTYDNTDGWSVMLKRSLLTVLILVSLGVCIMVSPLFAEEYQTSADSLILSARHGRGKVIGAKIAAAFQLTSTLYFAAVALNTLMLLLVFGAQGWNCEFQMLSPNSYYPVTILQVFAYGIAINYFVVLAVMAFTMFLSSVCRTTFATVIISSVTVFAPMFIPTSKSSKAFNYVLNLLPAKALDTYTVFSVYDVYSFGNAVFSLPVMILAFSIIIILVTIPIAQESFRRHQVAE